MSWWRIRMKGAVQGQRDLGIDMIQGKQSKVKKLSETPVRVSQESNGREEHGRVGFIRASESEPTPWASTGYGKAKKSL